MPNKSKVEYECESRENELVSSISEMIPAQLNFKDGFIASEIGKEHFNGHIILIIGDVCMVDPNVKTIFPVF
jgi:hypothetical protein